MISGRSDLVSKSVRLPSDLVAFIEQSEGKDFSKKLIGILEDYISGDDSRQSDIKEYNRLVEMRSAELQRYSKNIYEASRICAECAKVVKLCSGFLEEKGHDHLPRDANLLELSPEESNFLEFYRNLSEKSRYYLLQYVKSF